MQILIHPDFLAQHAYHKYFRIISTLYYSCYTCDTRDTWRHLGNRMGPFTAKAYNINKPRALPWAGYLLALQTVPLNKIYALIP